MTAVFSTFLKTARRSPPTWQPKSEPALDSRLYLTGRGHVRSFGAAEERLASSSCPELQSDCGAGRAANRQHLNRPSLAPFRAAPPISCSAGSECACRSALAPGMMNDSRFVHRSNCLGVKCACNFVSFQSAAVGPALSPVAFDDGNLIYDRQDAFAG